MMIERAIGLFVLLLGLFALLVLIPGGIVTPQTVETASLSPAFWPRIVAVMFALTGISMAIRPGKSVVGDKIPLRVRAPRLLVVLSALFAFYFAMPSLGMVVPAIALIFGMMWFAGERRWLLMVVVSILVPVALYAFFVHVANIPIPLGVFEALRG